MKDGKRVVMSSRVNIQAAATLMRWFEEKGVYVPEKGQQSWFLNKVVETLAHSAVQSGTLFAVNSHKEALEVLAEAGIHFSKGSKTRKDIDLKVKPEVQREEADETEGKTFTTDMARQALEEVKKQNRQIKEQEEQLGRAKDNALGEDEETRAEGKNDGIAGMPE